MPVNMAVVVVVVVLVVIVDVSRKGLILRGRSSSHRLQYQESSGASTDALHSLLFSSKHIISLDLQADAAKGNESPALRKRRGREHESEGVKGGLQLL
jgi:hypothetical protein